jgi:hypothetical protein
MSEIRLVPPEVVAANWRRWRATQRRSQVPAPRPQNVPPVLDMGNTLFFVFQGRPYGVPSLPYKAGLQFVEIQGDLEPFQKGLHRKDLPEYQQILSRLARLIWRHCYPTGFRRVLRFFGLMRNPFDGATEAELGERLRFFDMCRTRSSVPRPMLATNLPARPTP